RVIVEPRAREVFAGGDLERAVTPSEVDRGQPRHLACLVTEVRVGAVPALAQLPAEVPTPALGPTIVEARAGEVVARRNRDRGPARAQVHTHERVHMRSEQVAAILSVVVAE